MTVENIPKGWRKVKLGDVCEVLKGSGLSKEKLTPDGKHSCILYGELYTVYDEIIKTVKSKTDSDEGIPSKKGDVLVPGSTTTIGIDLAKAVAINQNGVLLGGDINILRKIDDSYNSEYLAYYITHIKKYEIAKVTQGSTIIHLYGKNLKKIDLILPPIEIQNKIAEIIKTNDETIYETDNIIDNCERVKKGLMQILLLKGILGRHKKFKNTELGEIPEDWEIKDMKNLGSFDKGKGISKKELTESGIPCIRYGEIYTTHHIKIKKFFSFINKETIAESTLILKGDILLAGSGETLEDIGKAVTYLGTDEAYAGGDTIIFRPKKQNSLYFSYVLNSGIIREQINRLGQGHSVVHLYPRQLMNVQIPVPPIEEQNEIANILDELDYKIDIEKDKRNAILKLKLSLMQKLLSGEIRVRVN